jgi:transposase
VGISADAPAAGQTLHALRRLLQHGHTCIVRSEINAMKVDAVRSCAPPSRASSRGSDTPDQCLLEAVNDLFQAARRGTRGYGRMSTIKTVISPIAGKLDFRAIHPHAMQPT